MEAGEGKASLGAEVPTEAELMAEAERIWQEEQRRA